MATGDQIVGHVYVVKLCEHVKVGRSAKPWRRLEALRRQHHGLGLAMTYCTDSLDGATLVEARAHQILSGRRLDGEWFAATPEDAELAIKQAVCDVRKGWKFPPLNVWRGISRHRDALAEFVDLTHQRDWPERWK